MMMDSDRKDFPLTPERFDAVLFDLDGVLTATAKVHAGMGTLNPGESAVVTFELLVDAGVAPGTLISNQAFVASDERCCTGSYSTRGTSM